MVKKSMLVLLPLSMLFGVCIHPFASSAQNGGFVQQQKLIASDRGEFDLFGIAVAISGDTAVVGAYHDDDAGTDSGSAYVFVRSGTSWIQQQKLIGSNTVAGDNFGYSVAIDGDTIVVGAPLSGCQCAPGTANGPGAAYVFVRSGTTWTEQQKLVVDGQVNRGLGWSVGISGDTIAIGAPFDYAPAAEAGSAYIFVRSGNVWTQQQRIVASDGAPNDNLAYSLAISGNTIVAGAYLDDDAGDRSGSAYVFARNGATWSQQQKLVANDATAGDTFGYSVGLGGDTIIVGSPSHPDAGTDAGSAYIFVQSGTTWSQQQKIIGSHVMPNDQFGFSVGISGGTALVGSPFHASDVAGGRQGLVYVYKRSGVTWTEQQTLVPDLGLVKSGLAPVGGRVSIDGQTVLLGIPFDDYNEETYIVDSGSAYVFSVPSAAPFVCDGQNFNNDNVLSGDCTGSPMLAITWVPAANETISRVEVFTGFSTGSRQPNRLAIWSDDGGSPSRPLASLASTPPFNVVSTNSWQGTDLSASLTVTAGQKYWVVWDPDVAQTCSSSTDATGTRLTYWGSSSGTVDAGASWNGPFGQPYNNQIDDRWKFRMFCGTSCPTGLAITGSVPSFCEGASQPVSLAATGANLLGATITWSLSGPVTNPSLGTGISLNTTLNGLMAGMYLITATATRPACQSVAVSVSFNVQPMTTTADAGPDQTLCETSTATLYGNVPTTGAGTWSVVSGAATITNPSSPSTSITGLAYGFTVLRWTITSACGGSSDDVTLTRFQMPTVANAGPDQEFCENTSTTLSANVPSSGSGTWTRVSGSGTIVQPNNPSTQITDLAYGTSVFRWTITNSSCAPSADDVAITRNMCLTSLGPAKVWLGLKNSDDVGVKFDLKAEVFKSGTLVGSGTLLGVPGGSSGFNNAVARLISLSLPAPVPCSAGETFSITLSARLSTLSNHKGGGTARLWFNDAAADSNFAATIGGQARAYYLTDNFVLSLNPGPGPKKTTDVLVVQPFSQWYTFGTWSLTL